MAKINSKSTRKALFDEVARLNKRIAELEKRNQSERRAIEGASDGLFDRPVNNGVTWVSPKWQATFGLTNESPSFDEFADRIHPQDLNRFKSALNRSLQEHQMRSKSFDSSSSPVEYSCVYRVLPFSVAADHESSSSADYLWVRASGRVLEENGEIFLSGAHSNITNERAKQEAFENWENIFQRIIQTDPNLIFIKDRNHCFYLVNQALAEFYGATPEEIKGKSDDEFSLEDKQRGICWDDDMKVLEGIETDGAHVLPRQLTRIEKLTSWKGEEKWFRTVKKPILIEGSQNLLGISTDITETVVAREELQQIIDQVPIPIHTKTPDLKYDTANQAFLGLVSDILGRPVNLKDIKRKTAGEIYGNQNEQFWKEIETIDRQTLEDPKGYHEEFTEISFACGGSNKFRFIRIKRRDGGLLGVSINITEQEKEAKLENMKALALVFRSLSHSLLDVVVDGVKLELLPHKKEIDYPNIVVLLDFLQSYIYRLKELQTALEDDDHKERKMVKLQVQQTKANLLQLVDRAVKVMSNFIPEIPIENKIPGSIELLCDERLMQMVFIELIHNSKKFTYNNHKASPIEINASIEEKTVKISVDDCGVGPIGVTDTWEWFNLFSTGVPKASGETSLSGTAKDGTGFGLSYAEWIVNSHNGNFNKPVVGKNGCGTVLSFEIPSAIE